MQDNLRLQISVHLYVINSSRFASVSTSSGSKGLCSSLLIRLFRLKCIGAMGYRCHFHQLLHDHYTCGLAKSTLHFCFEVDAIQLRSLHNESK